MVEESRQGSRFAGKTARDDEARIVIKRIDAVRILREELAIAPCWAVEPYIEPRQSQLPAMQMACNDEIKVIFRIDVGALGPVRKKNSQMLWV